MDRWFDAIVDGNTVYGGTVKIYSYDVASDSWPAAAWSKLLDCVHACSSLTMIKGWLTTVGGESSPSTYSNVLLNLTGEGSGRRWTEKFPPMPTKRGLTSSLCTGATLIVAGGKGEGRRVLSTDEVMNTETHQWSTAADLPQPTYLASASDCGAQVYIVRGANKDGKSTKSVYTCFKEDLCQQPQSATSTVWRKVADLPVIRSTCESFHGRLLAFGRKKGPTETYHSCLHVRLDYQLLGNHQSYDNCSMELLYSGPPWQPTDSNGRLHW